MPIEGFASPYPLPAVLQFYPEVLVFKDAFHDICQCLKAHVKEMLLPIILYLSALSTRLSFLSFFSFLSLFFLHLCFCCFCFFSFFFF